MRNKRKKKAQEETGDPAGQSATVTEDLPAELNTRKKGRKPAQENHGDAGPMIRLVWKCEHSRTFAQVLKGKQALVQISTSHFMERTKEVAEMLLAQAHSGKSKEELKQAKQMLLRNE